MNCCTCRTEQKKKRRKKTQCRERYILLRYIMLQKYVRMYSSSITLALGMLICIHVQSAMIQCCDTRGKKPVSCKELIAHSQRLTTAGCFIDMNSKYSHERHSARARHCGLQVARLSSATSRNINTIQVGPRLLWRSNYHDN